MAEDDLIIKCTRCGTKNRVPGTRLKDNPICGKCRQPLLNRDGYDRPVDITDGTFDREVLQEPGVVLVDCWAPWCGPCRMVAPVLEKLAREYAGRIKIAKLNVDENPITASKYAVRSIPTMLFFKSGSLVDTLIGALPKQAIEERVIALTRAKDV
ncbi:MAG: thiol reductase thioredoxin [Desulfococcus sp. 4484_242]|nr:MAG: thiol reductase thioredoxin [Desulfococcus sp. 4484_242]RLB96142.1 MAG: thiol reductase thioredoxin [Deltaproteobacteria bacterium]